MASSLKFASLGALAEYVKNNASRLKKDELERLLETALKDHLHEELAQYSSAKGNGIGIRTVQCRDSNNRVLWEQKGSINIDRVALTLNTLCLFVHGAASEQRRA